MVLGDWYMQY